MCALVVFSTIPRRITSRFGAAWWRCRSLCPKADLPLLIPWRITNGHGAAQWHCRSLCPSVQHHSHRMAKGFIHPSLGHSPDDPRPVGVAPDRSGLHVAPRWVSPFIAPRGCLLLCTSWVSPSVHHMGVSFSCTAWVSPFVSPRRRVTIGMGAA